MTRLLPAIICLAVTTTAVSALVAPSSTSPADEQFHSWCDTMGVAINPSVRLITTPTSVAGRGVFSVENLVQDEIIAKIPTYAMFHPSNCESMFPEKVAQLQQQNRASCSPDEARASTITKGKGIRNLLGRLKRRLSRRKNKAPAASIIDSEQQPEEETWQVELTEYALEVLDSEHPLSPWIQQWQRDDPVLRMFQKGVTMDDQESVAAVAYELQQLVPELPSNKIMAALNIRLEQYQSQKSLFVSDPTSVETVTMYNVLCSRTIEVADGIIGAVPFHDMINHSFEPNIGLAISDDGQELELIALSDVAAGEELFLCYSKVGQEYEENQAVWMLVQWGIPVFKSDYKK